MSKPNKRSFQTEENQRATTTTTTNKILAACRDATEGVSSGGIHLLLPSPNGVFPYLTPVLAERYFGAFGCSGSNRLWLGVAVRDTCVVPRFGKSNTTTSKVDVNTGNTAANTHQTNDDNDNKKKPTGYSISFVPTTTTNLSSTSLQKDEAVLPNFTHVTVPSFDLLQDEMDYQHQQKQQQGKTFKRKMKTPTNQSAVPVTSNLTTTVVPTIESTNRHVMVWTPHGRQKLTPDQYQQAAQGLNSSYTVSLYDQCPDAGTSQRRRRQLVQQRNAEWLKQLIINTKDNNNIDSQSIIPTTNGKRPSCIVPWVITNQELEDCDENKSTTTNGNQVNSTTAHDIRSLLQQQQQIHHSSFLGGIALIGWPHLSMPPQQLSKLSSVLMQLQQFNDTTNFSTASTAPSLLFMVLEARSISQILDAMQVGVHVIGTSLPLTWARQHKAFVIDFQHYHSTTHVTQSPSKRPRVESPPPPPPSPSLSEQQQQVEMACDENGCWDMTQTQFRLDQRPLIHGCTCFTCGGSDGSENLPSALKTTNDSLSSPPPPCTTIHPPAPRIASRAYVHHLVQTQELLGEMLLFAHNLHHMLQFFQYVATSVSSDQFKDFREYLQKHNSLP